MFDHWWTALVGLSTTSEEQFDAAVAHWSKPFVWPVLTGAICAGLTWGVMQGRVAANERISELQIAQLQVADAMCRDSQRDESSAINLLDNRITAAEQQIGINTNRLTTLERRSR